MRYFFEISYNGTHYHGWQNQANAVGVQSVVENALRKILREAISITGSGRTDTGVHCAQQFFHADIDTPFDPPHLLIRLNSFLPKDIAIRTVFPVRPDAHARYDARRRTYAYTITRTKNPFLTGQAYYFFRPLNIAAMNQAAAKLKGTHDFESFSKVKTDVNHFECTIFSASWKEKKDALIFTVSANRFLRGMVRAMVGTLLDIGTGKLSQNGLKAILDSRDRRQAGSNVPPEGLSLIRVVYSRKIIPTPEKQPD